MIDHEHYMHIALEEAERGAAEGNAAVAVSYTHLTLPTIYSV